MAQTENPSRERILSRIRTALRPFAPKQPATTGKRVFSPVTDALDRFQKEEECR